MMKGVYSAPDALLTLLWVLFPDTPYRFESGGLPEQFQLTQAAFEKFHQTYYSPENSYIYLYGDLDIEITWLIWTVIYKRLQKQGGPFRDSAATVKERFYGGSERLIRWPRGRYPC